MNRTKGLILKFKGADNVKMGFNSTQEPIRNDVQ